jgi:hypothetical protein
MRGLFARGQRGDRVRAHTPAEANREIDRRTRDRVVSQVMSRVEVRSGLSALDAERDVKRVQETNAASLALAGLALGLATRRRGWLALRAVDA